MAVIGRTTAKSGTPPISWEGRREGECPVVCVKVELVEQTFDKKQGPREQLEFHFRPVDDTGEGVLRFWTGLAIKHRNAKLPSVYAALGLPVPTGEVDIVDTDFIGKRAVAVVKLKPSTRNPGEQFPVIIALLPDPNAGEPDIDY
jgi:hypothetical protein